MKQIAKSFLMVLALGGVARANEVGPPKPAEQRPGCFAESVRISPEVRGRLPKAVALQFTVTEQGRIQDVSTGDAVEPAITTQLRGALARCDWVPAADARGPKSARVEMPVRFEIGRDAAASHAAEHAGTSVPVATR